MGNGKHILFLQILVDDTLQSLPYTYINP